MKNITMVLFKPAIKFAPFTYKQTVFENDMPGFSIRDLNFRQLFILIGFLKRFAFMPSCFIPTAITYQ